jgi:hypothetical protein
MRQLDGVTARPVKIPFSDKNVRAYLWMRGGKAILTAWAIKGTASLPVRLGRCTVTDAFGMERNMTVDPSLPLTDFPVYITDIANPGDVKALEAQARAGAEQEKRRLDRLARSEPSLFAFGSADQVSTLNLAPGIEKKFTPVVAADRYSEAQGYGFEAQSAGKVLGNKNESWRRNPLIANEVILAAGARFRFKTPPGDYVMQIGARSEKDTPLFIRGLDGGDQTLPLLSTREIFTTTVKVGASPVTLETGPDFFGALCWLSLVPIDREGE